MSGREEQLKKETERVIESGCGILITDSKRENKIVQDAIQLAKQQGRESDMLILDFNSAAANNSSTFNPLFLLISEQYGINQRLKDEVNDMLLKSKIPLDLEFIERLKQLSHNDILKLSGCLV